MTLQIMSDPISPTKPGVALQVYAFTLEYFCLSYSHSLYQVVQNRTEMVLMVFSDLKTFLKASNSVFSC